MFHAHNDQEVIVREAFNLLIIPKIDHHLHPAISSLSLCPYFVTSTFPDLYPLTL